MAQAWWHRKGMDKYKFRNDILRSLGYPEPVYKSYLKSQDWILIRTAVLEAWPLCVMCQQVATIVHHMQYDIGTLLGLHYSELAPLCHRCHESVELARDGNKTDLHRSRNKVKKRAEKSDYGTRWLRACAKEWSLKCQKQQLNKRIIGMEREIRELLNATNPDKVIAKRYAQL